MGHQGKERHPEADGLFITADCGAATVTERGCGKLSCSGLLTITVRHFPPGTSKWNKIEHRLFSFITTSRRGKPLHPHQTVVNLIVATMTAMGFEVQCELDSRGYDKGRKASFMEISAIRVQPGRFHVEWNYTLEPRSR